MSRLIIKNLPKTIKEERLRKLFTQKGHLTDCSMKYTKDGMFRKFAFVGYKTCEEAEAAVEHFNQTYIDTSKILVEIARDFGDAAKPRAWSKYSKDSSQYNKQKSEKGTKGDIDSDKKTDEKPDKKKKKKENKLDMLLGELKDNPEFHEFLEVHKNRSTKSLWENDMLGATGSGAKKGSESPKDSSGMTADSSDDDDADEEIEESTNVTQKSVTDLEYLKSKVKQSNLLSGDTSDDDDDDDDNEENSDTSESGSSSESVSESEGSGSESGISSDLEEDHAKSAKKAGSKKEKDEPATDTTTSEDHAQPEEAYIYTVKMKGLPVNVKESQIVEFFRPLETTSIKIPRNAKGTNMRLATVMFKTEDDMEKAMGRNKNFVGSKKVFLHKVKEKIADARTKFRPWELKKDEDVEGIDESGRLFVRNLAYCCEETDLEELFSKFGPLTEVVLPLDNFTKKTKGFAFVTYMMPEHAVKAYAELDGNVFMGRMMHILPAKAKKEQEIPDNLSFKKKKELKQKQEASSSHNWNTLFLGANAVADVMADRYGTSKDHILSAEGRQSLGVRLALGETQIVAETRDFLIENGVVLDAFSHAAGPRSKAAILAKNLPAGTEASELATMFGKFGTLGRIVLPPSGLTAIIEFGHPSEAKAAFTSLAYTKFKDMPLYLEWAPVGVFADPTKASGKGKALEVEDEPDGAESSTNNSMKQEKEGPEDAWDGASKETETSKVKKAKEKPMEEETEAEPGSTVFVKNLNFDTTDTSLSEHFQGCGRLHKVSIATKRDLKNPGSVLSMGYGFIEYVKKKSADKALKRLQHSMLDGHELQLKISHRAIEEKTSASSKKQKREAKQSSKILVRNIPFEAKVHEVRELFTVFGELKSVRLPKKPSGTGTHRGFGFVDYLTKEDAKRAFNTLCHSTHLYGRHLVLEWADTEETVDDLRRKTAENFHGEPAKKRFKKSALVDDLKSSNTKDEGD